MTKNTDNAPYCSYPRDNISLFFLHRKSGIRRNW